MADDDQLIQLTRRRALGGLAGIGAASAALGAGTMAYFSDQVNSNNNTIESGNIDLQTNGNNAATRTFNVGPVGPGDSGTATLQVSNVGNLGGFTSLSFGTPENQNHLIEVLEITVSFKGNVIRRGTFETVFDGEGEWSNADIPLGANSSGTLKIEWKLPGAAGNDVQSEVAKADYTVHLNQQEEAFADLVVDASGGGNVSTIQDGVDATPSGGVVLVRDGTYKEAVTIDKSDLTLAAKNRLGAKIEPSATGNGNKAVTVDGVSGATIDGFDISFNGADSTNGEKYAIRARAASDDLTVRNCDIGRFSASDVSGNDGAVRATGLTITSTQGPGSGSQVDDPIVENNVFTDIKCTGGIDHDSDNTGLDDDSKAKGVALNGNVYNAKVNNNEITNIGSAGGTNEDPNTADEVENSGVTGTEKPRGISLVEDSDGTGPRNFTILDNRFQNIVGTWGQPAVFIGGSNDLGPDHEMYENEFHHPVDNLSGGVLRLRNNTWVNDEDGDGMPELVDPDADNDGGNLIDRAGGSEYDTTYTL